MQLLFLCIFNVSSRKVRHDPSCTSPIGNVRQKLPRGIRPPLRIFLPGFLGPAAITGVGSVLLSEPDARETNEKEEGEQRE